MKREVNLMTRGVGDCRIAGPEYQIILESRSEAQKIADLVHKEFKLVIKPAVQILRRKCKQLNGTANHNTGLIRLYLNGSNVGVLLHELAHLEKRAAKRCSEGGYKMKGRKLVRVKRVIHGSEFKYAQTKIILFWRQSLEKIFNITGKKVTWEDREKARREAQEKRTKELFGEIRKYKYVGRITLGPAKKEEIVEDTEEENRDLIHGLMDKLAKYAVYESLSINSIVRCFWVNGVKNTDENRKIAIDYVKNELNLRIVSFK